MGAKCTRHAVEQTAEGPEVLLTRSRQDDTSMQFASHYQNTSLNVNVTEEEKLTALMKAAGEGRIDVVRYLVGECGTYVDVRHQFGFTALMKAAADGHYNVVRCLAGEYGADVNAIDKFGITAMMSAAEYGHVEIVQYLAEECGADVNARDDDGYTALMRAAHQGRTDVVRCLVGTCRAEVESTDDEGFTALMKAVGEGHDDTVRYLVGDAAANVNAKSSTRTTAIMMAAESGNLVVVEYLAGEYSADVNAQDECGFTALMKAAAEGHFAVVEYLAVNCGAGVNITNNDECTAIQIAASRGYQEIQRVLTPLLVAGQSKTYHIPATHIAFIPPSEISLINFVETGNVGGEFRAKWLDADAAVKLFIPDASSHSSFEDEVRLWHQLRHPNVIKMYGACDASPLPLQFFVCEYASSGSLLEYAHSVHRHEEKVWTYLHQAALGLEYLHERGIIHGDLRCSNILIGSDGLAKLANFARSGSMRQFSLNVTIVRVGSARWQAPEILRGDPLSFKSDVYSLGICILEAVTGEMPWRSKDNRLIETSKLLWNPKADERSFWDPNCPFEIARTLVWRMCCNEPNKRTTLSSVVRELERVAMDERSASTQLNYEPLSTVDDYKFGKTAELWMEVQNLIGKCDSDLHRHAFNELHKIHGLLQGNNHPPKVLDGFHTLVRDLREIITMSSEQTRILQLSATRATNASMVAFRHHLNSMWTALNMPVDTIREREMLWNQQHSEQIEIFVSEASKTYLLLEQLMSPEDKSFLLASLKMEINHPFKYTPGQQEVLMKAYQDIASTLETDNLSTLTPKWFIPWYELIVDKYDPLGTGGYGSVFQAKWLDSNVVVKRLTDSGDDGGDISSLSCYSLLGTSSTATNAPIRAAKLAVFRHEVDIWFGFSHPHVVRLFGACHVGRPSFVCEYATNGTRISYLKEHPNELWSKLHEAALGVQYLHARNVVHGDLKGNNIVVGSDMKAKVTDFGLSSITADDDKPRISGASHWVAPECFIEENARPTFASDIYSLGMCIVEALRVVEAGEDRTRVCSPWGSIDNNVVKYHVRHGKLPTRPTICQDEQWGLVQRMCVFEPEKRLKTSTVVDELARLSDNPHEHHPETTPTNVESITEVISSTLELLRLKDETQDISSQDSALYSLYGSLWGELKEVHSHLGDTLKTTGSCASFCSLVDDANKSTKELEYIGRSLVSLAESAMRCYTLRRRLHKFAEAQFLPLRYLERQCRDIDTERVRDRGLAHAESSD